jgi:hypothetical protein
MTELKIDKKFIDNGKMWIEYRHVDSNETPRVMSAELRNPIHVLSIADKLDANSISEILEAFESSMPVIDMSKRVKFNNEVEKVEYIKELKDMIDEHAQYIDSYRDYKSTIENNKYLRRTIDIVQKNNCIPETISKKGYQFLIKQAFGILEGLERRTDRYTVAHTIRWIKKLGFKLTNTDKDNNIAHYTFNMLGRDNQRFVKMCYEIRKANGEYRVRFLYDIPTLDSLDNGYGEVYSNPRANELKSSDKTYYSVNF